MTKSTLPCPVGLVSITSPCDSLTRVKPISPPHCGNSLFYYFSLLFYWLGLPTWLSSTYLKSIILHGSAQLYHLHISLLFLLNSFSADILNTCWCIPPCCFISIHLTNKPGGSTIAKYYLGTRDSAVNKAASHGVYVPTGAPASRVHIWILSSFTTATVLVFSLRLWKSNITSLLYSLSLIKQCPGGVSI